MFTLKFVNNKSGFTRVVAAERYELQAVMSGQVSGVCVGTNIMHYSRADDAGLSHYIGNEDSEFHMAYIENAIGKTIDRIGPFHVSGPNVSSQS